LNDLDLAPIAAHAQAYAKLGVGRLVNAALLAGAAEDLAILLAEVRRLRADRDHARAWALYWRYNALEGDEDAGDRWPEGAASDGWLVEPQAWEKEESP